MTNTHLFLLYHRDFDKKTPAVFSFKGKEKVPQLISHFLLPNKTEWTDIAVIVSGATWLSVRPFYVNSDQEQQILFSPSS